MERVGEHDSAMRDLGLLKDTESVGALSFRDLQRRIEDHVSANSVTSRGVKRWPDKLIEPLLCKRALKSGAGALSLAVVAWVLAAARVTDAVR